MKTATRLMVLLLLSGGLAFGQPPAPRDWPTIQKELDLNEDQAKRLKPMVEDFHRKQMVYVQEFRDQLHAILTPEQKTRLDAIHASHQHPSGGLTKALGLSAQQCDKVKALHRTKVSKIEGIEDDLLDKSKTFLTTPQQQKLHDMLTPPEHH